MGGVLKLVVKQQSEMNFLERTKAEKMNVLDLFRRHEAERVPSDLFALSIIDRLRNSNFDFYSVVLGESELKNIILPHHDHSSNIVPPGGMPILDCCEIFRKRTKEAPSECFSKVSEKGGNAAREFKISEFLYSSIIRWGDGAPKAL